MNPPVNQKNALSELLHVFSLGFKTFFRNLQLFFEASLAIVTFKPIFEDLQTTERKHLSDIKYAYLIFEYLLIIFILSRIFSEGNSEEIEEIVQEFLILILYLFEIGFVLVTGQLVHKLLFHNQDKRTVQGLVLYGFCLPFFPTYLVTYAAYDAFDEEIFDGILLLVFLGFLVFFSYYFYQLSRAFANKPLKSLSIGVVLSIGFSLLLLLSIAFITGATYGENA